MFNPGIFNDPGDQSFPKDSVEEIRKLTHDECDTAINLRVEQKLLLKKIQKYVAMNQRFISGLQLETNIFDRQLIIGKQDGERNFVLLAIKNQEREG